MALARGRGVWKPERKETRTLKLRARDAAELRLLLQSSGTALTSLVTPGSFIISFSIILQRSPPRITLIAYNYSWVVHLFFLIWKIQMV